MDQKNKLGRKQRKYLEKLIKKTFKIQQSKKAIQQRQNHIQTSFQNGDLVIEKKSEKIQDLIDCKNNKSISQFYLLTDRNKSKEVYQEMKKLRQEYSHQKTSLVVQQVEKKIKDWTLKQQIADKKRMEYFQQKIKEEQQIMERTKIQKKSWKEMQKINHHQEILKRLQKLKQKKQRREEQLKESNLKFKQTIEKVPLYILKQKQFREKQHQQESKVKSLSKKNSTSLQNMNLKEHQQQYLQKIKQREQIRRQKSLSSLSRIRTPKFRYSNKISEIKEQSELQDSKRKQKTNPESYSHTETSQKKFVTYFKSEQVKQKQEMKRQKRMQFVKKIKQLQPDQKILSRIKVKKSQQKLLKEIEKEEKKKKVKRVSSSVRLGNEYLKQVIQNSQKLKKTQNSVSLPLIKQPAPRYPNYLEQLRQKAQKSNKKVDQIQRVKRIYKQPQQVLQQLNKKYLHYQNSMSKKIKELEKGHHKYDDHLKKQVQIDELFYKSLKMRLACLQIS